MPPPPPQQPETETSRKVAALRGFLQKETSRTRVAPLVSSLIARNIDIHERMLTDLRNKFQQMKDSLSSESEHADRVSKRLQNIEHDVKSLRQLIQENGQRDVKDGANIDQVKTELVDAVQQVATKTTSLEKHLQTIEAAIEGQRQTTDGIKGNLDTTAQHIVVLQHDIEKLKSNPDKESVATSVLDSIAKLEEKIAKHFDQNSEPDIKHYLETITTNLDLVKNSSYQCPINSKTGQSINNEDHTSRPGHSITTSQEHELATSNQPDLQSWPAIVDFIATYEHFREIYKSKEISNETQFMKAFLSKINVHVSCALQRHLLDIYPNKAALVSLKVGQQPPIIFIRLGRMRWNDIRRAIPKITDLKSLQWAVDEGISGPLPTQISRQDPEYEDQSPSASSNPEAKQKRVRSGYWGRGKAPPRSSRNKISKSRGVSRKGRK
ncbi:hypothetical protein F5Y10DRAFT_294213 [Nemania abortiva]|nr:hypothetical protein F5Y10DRAFT_294213 [Nemania abortiva]